MNSPVVTVWASSWLISQSKCLANLAQFARFPRTVAASSTYRLFNKPSHEHPASSPYSSAKFKASPYAPILSMHCRVRATAPSSWNRSCLETAKAVNVSCTCSFTNILCCFKGDVERNRVKKKLSFSTCTTLIVVRISNGFGKSMKNSFFASLFLRLHLFLVINAPFFHVFHHT